MALYLKEEVEESTSEKGMNFQLVKSKIKPEFMAWVGGAIVSKLPFAYHYWITKTEYME